MSQFDPQTFLDATIDAPLEARGRLPVENPETADKLYVGVIGEITARPWQGKVDPSKSGIAWDVPITLQVPGSLQDSVGKAELVIKDSIMLDLTPNGTIDTAKGRNNGLRFYREATDLNKAGDSFSARKMQGKVIKVKIAHETYNGMIMERINGVLRA